MDQRHKYARVEWERRFLVDHFPKNLDVTNVRRILDLYIDGTSLRLRHIIDSMGRSEFKLTQKLAEAGAGARQGLITTVYLAKSEFDVLARLPGRSLAKTRYSVPPFGFDVFEGELRGLLLAEAEFHSDEEAAGLQLLSCLHAEVSRDGRFSGGNLARASRVELADWLSEFGIALSLA